MGICHTSNIALMLYKVCKVGSNTIFEHKILVSRNWMHLRANWVNMYVENIVSMKLNVYNNIVYGADEFFAKNILIGSYARIAYIYQRLF